jgi:hypothetical protein
MIKYNSDQNFVVQCRTEGFLRLTYKSSEFVSTLLQEKLNPFDFSAGVKLVKNLKI